MPYISRFFGIVIPIFFNDHAPPHFHAEYGEEEAVYEIETLEIQRGQLLRRAHALVIEWATLHRVELLSDWDKARLQVPLDPIEPLD